MAMQPLEFVYCHKIV